MIISGIEPKRIKNPVMMTNSRISVLTEREIDMGFG
jgi:hypothetical protein